VKKMEPVSIYIRSSNTPWLVAQTVVQRIKKWVPVLCVFFAGGCKKYLDVVPDNVATIDNAFKLKQEATKYLATCYSYLPASGDLETNPALCAGDEFWMVAPFALENSHGESIGQYDLFVVMEQHVQRFSRL
jgi:hypothetical protein